MSMPIVYGGAKPSTGFKKYLESKYHTVLNDGEIFYGKYDTDWFSWSLLSIEEKKKYD